MRKNHEILAREVMVIGPTGVIHGALPIAEAVALAKQQELDLVEVGPLAQPPVCKILDYGKYLYQLEKKDRKSRAAQKKMSVKGIRLTLNIGEHDLEIRRSQSNKFLEAGHKVQLEMRLRGREKAHRPRAIELLNRFAQSLAYSVTWEQPVKAMGGNISAILSRGKSSPPPPSEEPANNP